MLFKGMCSRVVLDGGYLKSRCLVVSCTVLVLLGGCKSADISRNYVSVKSTENIGSESKQTIKIPIGYYDTIVGELTLDTSWQAGFYFIGNDGIEHEMTDLSTTITVADWYVGGYLNNTSEIVTAVNVYNYPDGDLIFSVKPVDYGAEYKEISDMYASNVNVVSKLEELGSDSFYYSTNSNEKCSLTVVKSIANGYIVSATLSGIDVGDIEDLSKNLLSLLV